MSKRYKKAREDILTGGLSMLFAVLFFLSTYTFRLVDVNNTVNAAFFPRIISVIVFVLAAIILFRGYALLKRIPQSERTIPDEERKENRRGLIRVAEVFLVLLLAAATFKKMGFILTMPWTMFALFVILEKKEKRKYPLYLAISIIAPTVLFFIFYYGFTQLLPMGILKPILSRFL